MRLVCSLLCTKGFTEVVQTSDREWTLATERLFTAVPRCQLLRALSGGILGGTPYRRNSNQRKLPLTRVNTILQIMLLF